jgi:hypothetical protein
MTTTYYLEHSNPSDISPYNTLTTTDAGNPAANIYMEYVNSSAYANLVDELITDAGVPGAGTITAVYGFLASMWVATDILANVFSIQVDLLRYKTTGTIASRTTSFEYHTAIGPGSRDYIKRNSAEGSFITDGFTAGCRILVSGTSGYNDGSYVVQEVTASTLTLEISSRLVDRETISSTISTKEKMFATATSGGVSALEEQLSWTNSGNIPDETFASDDRLIAKVWVTKEIGQSNASMIIETEGTHPAWVVIS